MISRESYFAKELIKSIWIFMKSDVDYAESTLNIISKIDREVRRLIWESNISEHQQLEQDYIDFRRQLLSAMREEKIQSFSDVSSFLVKFWTSEIPKSIQEQNVLSVKLDDDFWEKSFAEKPIDGVVYRWGTARKILREYLDIEPNTADDNTDIDVFVWPWKKVDDVIEYFSCDAEWVTKLDNISEQALLDKCKLVDLSMNQVLVTADRIYYTEKTELALKTWNCELLEEPDSLFWKKQHTSNLGHTVFTNTKIYRVLSMIVRGKIDNVSVRIDNISSENADAIGWMDKYIMIVFKKIIAEASNEEGLDINKLSLMIYRYTDLLVQMWYIGTHEECFDFLAQTHVEGPIKIYDSYLQPDFNDWGKRDMIWRIDKMTRVLVRKIVPEELDWFIYHHANETVQLGVDYDKYEEFRNAFENNWRDFHSKIRLQDEEK